MRLKLICVAAMASVLLGLAGCQALPGALRGAVSAGATFGATAGDRVENPVTAGPIAVTSLDDPVPVPGGARGGALGGAQTPPPAKDVPEEEGDPTPLAPLPDRMPDADTPPQTAEPVAPVVIKTASHLACEKRGGRWSVAGGGTAAFCQSPTRDAGKSCLKSTDCAGYCLEKSRTCAPVTPMLGCHDILNETGRMLTQCIN